jgi:hypothetical protein
VSRVHGWNIAVVGCLAAGALLLGCGDKENKPPDGAEETQDSPYRENYARYAEAVQEKLASGECKLGSTCGEQAFIDCHSEVDGPAYYIHSPTGRVLEVCGGACMGGPGQNGWCMACPPPEWTCKR